MTRGSTDPAAVQLEAIARLDAALTGAAIEYWLFGGWAVDFWAGRVTRAHDDVDAAVWRTDEGAIERALSAAGWRHTPSDEDVVGTRYTWRTALLELTFVEPRSDGAIVIPIPEREVVWTLDSFGEERRTLGGVSARTIPLSLLKRGKQVPREGAADAAKDVADFRALDDA
jgi:hypothetical protein